MFNRGYLQQVAMIESECDGRRKGVAGSLLDTMFHKSPLRERESKSVST